MIKVLCIDGGGTRGIIPASVLCNFENQLKIITENENAAISDFFDIIAGTSTGGILSLLYLTPNQNNRPLYNAKNALDLYIYNSNKIFAKSLIHQLYSGFGLFGAKYSSKNLQLLSNEYFKDTKISELLKCSLITSYDINNNKPIYFSKNGSGTCICKDFYARDVAVATSSAPTFFNAAKIKSECSKDFKLIDGGVFANNPSLCALTECFELFKNVNIADIKILSLGTGTKELSTVKITDKQQGFIFWATDIINVMMNASQLSSDRQLKDAYKALNIRENYLRIDVDTKSLKKPFPKMDASSKKDINYLVEIGENLARENSENIKNFIMK